MKFKTLAGVWFTVVFFHLTNLIHAQPRCVDVATIRIVQGEGALNNCQGDGIPNVITFTTSDLSTPFGYLVTDEAGTILFVSLQNTIDFENVPAGNHRVYGFSFIGTPLARVGGNVFTDRLGSICGALSTNFIALNTSNPDGGKVYSADGLSTKYICPGDGTPNVIDFVTTSNHPNYTYLITTTGNFILDITDSPNYDFEQSAEGRCRVWGLAYTGEMPAFIGQNAVAFRNDICADLSDSFIEVVKTVPDGGKVSFSNGTDSLSTCEGDPSAAILSFIRMNTSVAPYRFILTDENNQILQNNLDGNRLNFAALEVGAYRVWGVSYTGSFIANVGDNAGAANLSTDCFELSDNFVKVIKRGLDAGDISLSSGETAIEICANDGIPDLLTFQTTAATGDPFTYIVTDENLLVLGISEDGNIDFEGTGGGTCLVWGLVYNGNLLVNIGDDASTVTFADKCFRLSDNAVTVLRNAPAGGQVALTGGATTEQLCTGDGIPDVRTFEHSNSIGDEFVYLVTDENNIVLGISPEGSVDFENAGGGVCRVWGVSFYGNLTVAIGDDAASTALSDDCFKLSDNYVEIVKTFVDGGTVFFPGGGDVIEACTNDNQLDLVEFEFASTSSSPYGFIVTDENNIILAIAENGFYNFEGSAPGTYYIWGVSYSGILIASAGENVNDVPITDACFELSSNAITVISKAPKGGQVSISNGLTSESICVGDGLADVRTFVSQNASGGDFVFLVTDDNNQILMISEDGKVDFENARGGVCRVWGLSYTGTLTAAVGADAGAGGLSDDCFKLSDNFVEITRTFVDGGDISTASGIFSTVVCAGDGSSDIIAFIGTTTSTANYTFILTNENNEIILLPSGSTLNFDFAAAGTYRVYGLSFTGGLTAMIGDNISTTALSNECYDLTQGFILVRVERNRGGTVSLPGGGTTVYTCPGDGNPDIVSFDSTNTQGSRYAYVITDDNNQILGIADGDSFDFDGAGEGNCRVWGLSYSGTIIAALGDNAASTPLTSECFDLSDNFIEIIRVKPDGGSVATTTAETVVYTCPGDGVDDIVNFASTATAGEFYTYLITDNNNVILAISAEETFNFDGAPEGDCRIWGLAYSGNLTAAIGDNAAAASLSDDCYDLSDNYIEVRRAIPNGGNVLLEGGGDFINICPNDGRPDIVSFDSTATSNSRYAYLVTDENNSVLSVVVGDALNFDPAAPGLCRVWGVAYTGTLQVGVGDDAAAVALSDDCYDLSDNFISVLREAPEAGTITSPGGNDLLLCVGDGRADLVEFIIEGANRAKYTHLITDENNFLISVYEDPAFDFDNAVAGNCRIYGVAYTGLISLIPGDNILEVPLSNDCYDLTDNFIQLTRTQVDGGTIFTDSGSRDVEYVCAGDGLPDLIGFNTSSGGLPANYQFVITNTANTILAFIGGNEQDFETTGFDELRVWGISYTGSLTSQIGSDVSTSVLSDDCYAASDNYITIIRDQPEGGEVDANGENEVLICIGGSDGLVNMHNSSTSRAGYAYIVTDEANIIAQVSLTPAVDFNNLPAGFYRIWGLSYTGSILAAVGNDAATTDLASNCFELSTNFVRVERSETLDGGVLSTLSGELVIRTCPGDDISDLVILFTSSPDTNYRYVITDTLNNIIVPNINENIIDFDAAAPGISRIYGISFQDDFLPDFGDNVFGDELSSRCAAVSSNFVTVIREVPDGKTISTTAGETTLSLNVADGVADEVSFVSTASAQMPYAFLLTDENNIVLSILDGNSIDFEGSDLGIGRVWGLAYTGTLTIENGDDAATSILSTDCFDLSDNFVTVNRVDAFIANGNQNKQSGNGNISLELRPTALSLNIAPNPARDQLHLFYQLSGEVKASSELRIFNIAGQLVYQAQIPTVEGENKFSLDVNSFPKGTYAILLVNGKLIERQLLVKQ
ncbi:MAG: T9SS type A sorting domain-containing protein [Saprospiraceae bacterium]